VAPVHTASFFGGMPSSTPYYGAVLSDQQGL